MRLRNCFVFFSHWMRQNIFYIFYSEFFPQWGIDQNQSEKQKNIPDSLENENLLIWSNFN